MTGKRSRSFKCAVHHRDREVWSGSDYHLLPLFGTPDSKVKSMARLIANEFLTDERDRKYYADYYKCLPPPLFIISVTLIEVFTLYLNRPVQFSIFKVLSTSAQLTDDLNVAHENENIFIIGL
jgi:hypothetical protein